MPVARWRTLIALLLFCVVLVVLPGPQTPDTEVASANLLRALAAGTEADIYKVWVRYEPRGLVGADLALALDQAEANLNPRAARRRAKMHAAGERLVDEQDLPLNPGFLQSCEATGARLHQQSRWLNAASFKATAAQVSQLTHLSGVHSVSLVKGMQRAGVPTPVEPLLEMLPERTIEPGVGLGKTSAIDYGTNLAAMQQAGVLPVHDLGLSGAGILVGMLDTGFRTTHEALDNIPVLATWDFVNNDANVDNEGLDPVSSNSHGTMTLSTLAGHQPGQLVAPGYGVSVVLAKTEDVAVEVPLEEDNWVAGLEWAEALGADIISSSLGYIDWYVYDDLDGNTAVTTIAADLAADRGVIVVTSAGNDRGSTGYLIAPADANNVVTVGAVGLTGLVSWFSSPGPTADGRIKPDVSALGVSNTVADPTDDTSYAAASGTSFSCPLTSGVVALMLERVPGLAPAQVIDALRSTASQSATPDNDLGWGIIDAAAAVNWYGPVIAHAPLGTPADVAGPYVVTAQIADRVGLDLAGLWLNYSLDGGLWQSVAMMATGQPDEFAADIPGQPLATQVDYYLSAASSNGLSSSLPYAGVAAPTRFYVAEPAAVGEGRLPVLTHLAPNVPNPFNPQTELSFTLSRSGLTSLRIYDIRGQLVRTLLNDNLAAGPHAIVWDGRDNGGRALSSGTYFSRLVGAGETRQHKMQLVR